MFTTPFNYKITYAQCFKLPPPMFKAPSETGHTGAEQPNAAKSQANEYRILIFTTDYIYQLKVDMIEK